MITWNEAIPPLLCIGILIAYILYSRWQFAKFKTAKSKSSPEPIVKEIFVCDPGFTLLGHDWCWSGDQPTTYWCPVCCRPENVTLRTYKHAPSGKVFGIFAHSCGDVAETEPAIPVYQKAGGSR